MQAQYIYIHESLAEYIQCGDTSFPINGIHQVIKELCEKTGEKSKLTKQFDVSIIIVSVYMQITVCTFKELLLYVYEMLYNMKSVIQSEYTK